MYVFWYNYVKSMYEKWFTFKILALKNTKKQRINIDFAKEFETRFKMSNIEIDRQILERKSFKK